LCQEHGRLDSFPPYNLPNSICVIICRDYQSMSLWLQIFSANKMSGQFGNSTGGGSPPAASPPAPSTENGPTPAIPFLMTPQLQLQFQMQLLLRQTMAQMINYSQLAPPVVQPTTSSAVDDKRENEANTVTRFLTDKVSKKKKMPKEICCDGCAAPNCNECQHCRNRKWKKKCIKRQCLKKQAVPDKNSSLNRRTKRLLPLSD